MELPGGRSSTSLASSGTSVPAGIDDSVTVAVHSCHRQETWRSRGSELARDPRREPYASHHVRRPRGTVLALSCPSAEATRERNALCFRHQHPEPYGEEEVSEPAIPAFLRYGSDPLPSPSPNPLPEDPHGCLQRIAAVDRRWCLARHLLERHGEHLARRKGEPAPVW